MASEIGACEASLVVAVGAIYGAGVGNGHGLGVVKWLLQAPNPIPVLAVRWDFGRRQSQ